MIDYNGVYFGTSLQEMYFWEKGETNENYKKYWYQSGEGGVDDNTFTYCSDNTSSLTAIVLTEEGSLHFIYDIVLYTYYNGIYFKKATITSEYYFWLCNNIEDNIHIDATLSDTSIPNYYFQIEKTATDYINTINHQEYDVILDTTQQLVASDTSTVSWNYDYYQYVVNYHIQFPIRGDFFTYSNVTEDVKLIWKFHFDITLEEV